MNGRPFEDLIWELIGMTGWTPEYIDGLAIGKIHEYIQVMDGRARGQSSFFRRKQ